MGSLVWPVAVRQPTTPRIVLGRLFHWTLVTVAFGVIAGGVIASGLVLAGHELQGDLTQTDAAPLALIASGLGVGVFFFGRSLRYLIARE